LPDDPAQLRAAIQAAVAGQSDILFTTGGTGIGPRDITPDVVRPLLTREIPGIMEYIRVKSGASIPYALLSRSVAGLIGSTLVYALPGSEKAVQQYLDEILKTLEHSLRMLSGIDLH
jgi:molybdenum cofactor synthesis domain-containing protein